MNRICAVLAVVVILAGCASNEPVGDTGPVSEPPPRVELEPEAPARTIQWLMLRRPVMVGDPMPFGDSMFGPWRTGLERDADPGRRIDVQTVPVDFVRKSLHVTLRYLAAQAGVDLIIQPGTPDASVSVMMRNHSPAEVARVLCSANGLTFDVIDGVWHVGPKTPVKWPPSVVTGDFAGHYHADFDETDLVEAIMEVAGVSGAQVMIPSVPRTADEEDSEEYIGRIDQVRITLSVRNATPDHILRELARLGNMDVEVLLDEGDHPAYKITYRK